MCFEQGFTQENTNGLKLSGGMQWVLPSSVSKLGKSCERQQCRCFLVLGIFQFFQWDFEKESAFGYLQESLWLAL